MTTMFAVVSSTIQAIGYQEETENRKPQLTIIFNNGAQYIYEGVPKELWDEFREAESVGRFFIQRIKPYFKGVKQ